MRRCLLILVLLISVGLNAQRYSTGTKSMFEISAGGGWSSLGYTLSTTSDMLNARQSGAYSYTVHLGYGLFFSSNVGLGVGVDYTSFAASAALDGNMVWEGVTDTDGERYDHYTLIDGWRDQQRVGYIEIPLTLYLLFPTESAVCFSGEIGVKYGLPINSSGYYSGSLTHYGEYFPWGLRLENMPNHGFYTESNFKGNNKLTFNSEVSLFLKAGVQVRLTDKLHFIAHIYGQYGVLNAIKQNDADKIDLGFRNDRQGMETAHYFMQPYSGILNTTLCSDSSRPWTIGAEIGLRLFIPHLHRYPCKCYGVWR